MNPENKTYTTSSWIKFSLLNLIIVWVAFYTLNGIFTVSIDVAPRLSGNQAIAGICALAVGMVMLWLRMAGREDNKYYKALMDIRSLPVIVFLFYFSMYLIFHEDRTFANKANEAFYATTKILVENGYCGKRKEFSAHTNCYEDRVTLYGDLIAGGFEQFVYGVSNPKVLKLIRRMYSDIFFATPKMKHMIIHFSTRRDPNDQSGAENIFIEMRRN